MRFPQIEFPRLGAAAICLSLAWSQAHADWIGGKPRIGVEVEHEKAADRSWRSNSLTLAPGIKWEDGWLTMAELLLEVEQEKEAATGARETDRKFGVRLRKDVRLTPRLKASLRGLWGRSFAEDGHFTYAYVEPALKYSFDILEFTIGYRMLRSIDGSKGHDLNKLRLGPSFDLGQNREIEFRWVRGWDAHTGQHASDAYIVEFIHKF